ncbi:hypothetical protein BKA93DRAFT_793957 [Sparassis latifolia]|uniref:Uncharacterized protein n=1 Tax=Sparassis crispa TaxID=139825 RepID=A0A401G803_9APHY|nr:predicted protein [Sparassis crispa]GBE78292.1 predicted protein [Sparassis crispa]
MIAGVSKAITQHLAPVLALTSLLLILFSYLAPVVMLSSRVALLSVTPSTSLVQSNSSQGLDGPTVFMGALGSCYRPNKETGLVCTSPTVSPTYNLSVLPANAPDLLTSPPSTSSAFIAVSLAFSFLFFFMFTLTTHRAHLGRAGAPFEKPMVQRATAWIGFMGFIIGLTSFLVIYMWFGKAVQDFNDDISKTGSGAPELIAATSNGFVMVWVGYSFYAVPLVCALAKLHIAATAGKV